MALLSSVCLTIVSYVATFVVTPCFLANSWSSLALLDGIIGWIVPPMFSCGFPIRVSPSSCGYTDGLCKLTFFIMASYSGEDNKALPSCPNLVLTRLLSGIPCFFNTSYALLTCLDIVALPPGLSGWYIRCKLLNDFFASVIVLGVPNVPQAARCSSSGNNLAKFLAPAVAKRPVK